MEFVNAPTCRQNSTITNSKHKRLGFISENFEKIGKGAAEMEQKHISGMEGLHHTHLDIDDFLGEIVNYIKENEISEDVFFAWWDEVDLSNEAVGGPGSKGSFLNDMTALAEGWDFYFD